MKIQRKRTKQKKEKASFIYGLERPRRLNISCWDMFLSTMFLVIGFFHEKLFNFNSLPSQSQGNLTNEGSFFYKQDPLKPLELKLDYNMVCLVLKENIFHRN